MARRESGGSFSSSSSQEHALVHLGLASASAAVAETATFPVDTTKTRMQLLRSSPSKPRVGAVQVLSEIMRREGLLALYSGWSPAVVRHLIYTSTRIATYERLRESSLHKALAGGISGVVGQLVASPADLVKIRMQADGRAISQGLQPRYTGIVDALYKVVKNEGVRGLWRGVYPNVQRAFLVNMGELACYDHVKHFVVSNSFCNDNIYAHTYASVVSGFVSTLLSCPADVVKTRMMNQVICKQNGVVYKNSFDCINKTVRNEGMTALWKGFFPTWARLGPWQFVFWISYEKNQEFGWAVSFLGGCQIS